jgi:hypothetical protein
MKKASERKVKVFKVYAAFTKRTQQYKTPELLGAGDYHVIQMR